MFVIRQRWVMSKDVFTQRKVTIGNYRYSYFAVDAEYDNKLGLLIGNVTSKSLIID